MGAKFTPGPWVVGVHNELVLQESSKRIICEVNRDAAIGNRQHQLRTESDLLLIAAAPDLLSSLLGLMNHFDKASFDDAFANANAAVAKATGVTE